MAPSPPPLSYAYIPPSFVYCFCLCDECNDLVYIDVCRNLVFGDVCSILLPIMRLEISALFHLWTVWKMDVFWLSVTSFSSLIFVADGRVLIVCHNGVN